MEGENNSGSIDDLTAAVPEDIGRTGMSYDAEQRPFEDLYYSARYYVYRAFEIAGNILRPLS